MLTIAIWGAAGNMGTRACRRLRECAQYNLQHVELLPTGIDKLRFRGDTPVTPEQAAKTADLMLLAIADKFIEPVAGEWVPRLKSGAIVMMLDPAAAYAEI